MKQFLKYIICFSLIVVPATATMSTDLENMNIIIGNSNTGIIGITFSLLNVFMKPPILYFVVLGIFITLVGIVAGLLMRRGRRR